MNIEEMTNDTLSKSERLLDRIDEFPSGTVIQLYNMLETCARLLSESIKSVDTKLRVEVCRKLDLFLEYIIDKIPFPIQTGKGLHIYTPAIQGYRTWTNAELMKDKGLAGYMAAKVTGAKPVMFFCTKPEDYPYLGDLPQMQLLYADSQKETPSDYYDFLQKNYDKMDIMFLHGMYEQTINYLNAYRNLRPDGKVYCGLDMNSFWMGRIDWGNPFIQRFAAQCDLIATSCTSMRDKLNENPLVSFPCRNLPNGFYNPKDIEIVADASVKEDTIITVGRIGDLQKNTTELVLAFAQASHILKKWTLKLVGRIEPDFQAFMDKFFAEFPDLKGRVILTGAITDKVELYQEYAKAKVFALTSLAEGGAPNVYAEALFHGCLFVTSDIDAADDITNKGELGLKYKSGDIDALAQSLVTLCAKADARMVQEHIPKALDYAARYFDWNRNAKKLAYALLNPDIV